MNQTEREAAESVPISAEAYAYEAGKLFLTVHLEQSQHTIQFELTTHAADSPRVRGFARDE